MHPEEARALRTFRRTTTVTVVALSVVLLGLCCFIVAHSASDADSRAHLLGQSTHLRAQVVDKQESGTCKGGPKYAYTLQWTENGKQRSEVVRRCGNPHEAGDTIDIWSTAGMPYTESATMWRALLAGLLVSFLALTLLLGRVTLRTRRAVAAVLGGEPPVAVLPTTGSPVTGKLEVTLVDGDGTSRIHRIRPGRPIHSDFGSSQPRPASTMTGRISVSDMRRGKPRGVALYIGDDGARVWRFLG